VDLGRDGRVPQPPRRLSDPPFLAEVERACARLPGASVDRRDGYLAVTLVMAAEPAGLSERARALLGAFPEQEGRRTVRVDVRNRQWAALVVELAGAAHREPGGSLDA
jgi:hypothetical protein